MKYLLLLSTIIFGFTSLAKSQDSSVPSPPYGMSPLQTYSVFSSSYKSKDYQTALMYGRWLVKYSPKSLEGYPEGREYDGSRTMRRMINIYEDIAESKEDPSVKSTYLDSALTLYNKTIEIFNNDEIDVFEWKLNKARFLQKHSSFIDNGLARSYKIYEELFNKNPEKTTTLGDGYYVQILLQNLVSKNEKQKALDIIKKAEPYANEKTSNYFDKVRNQLFDSPEERINFLKSQLEKEPENIELLKELYKLYSDEDMTDKADEIAQKLYELQPNYENTKRLAENAISNANYQKAIKYSKEALDKTDNPDEQKKVAMDISDAYFNLDNLEQARRYARIAAQKDSNWGLPYIQIAKIYGRAISQCTSNRKMERKDRMVYWLVLDYLDRAKRVDPNVSSTVNQLYSSYKPVVPSTDDKFFMGLETGDEVKVNSSLDPCYGWINETTKVR